MHYPLYDNGEFGGKHSLPPDGIDLPGLCRSEPMPKARRIVQGTLQNRQTGALSNVV